MMQRLVDTVTSQFSDAMAERVNRIRRLISYGS